ncbi:hypothetical protein V3C99_003875 [Haemonchus contortus]
MMLLTLTILLPLVHSVAGTVCHAEPMKIVNTSTLLDPILEQLEKEGAIIWVLWLHITRDFQMYRTLASSS